MMDGMIDDLKLTSAPVDMIRRQHSSTAESQGRGRERSEREGDDKDDSSCLVEGEGSDERDAMR